MCSKIVPVPVDVRSTRPWIRIHEAILVMDWDPRFGRMLNGLNPKGAEHDHDRSLRRRRRNGKIPSVTMHREGGGASSRSRPRSPGCGECSRIRRWRQQGPEDSAEEQVAETQRTGREAPAVARDGHARLGAAAAGGRRWWRRRVCDVHVLGRARGDGGGGRRPRFAPGETV